MSMTDTTETIARQALAKLLTDGYVVIENLLDPATTADLHDRVQRMLDQEKANPFDPGPDAPAPDEDQLSWYARMWDVDDDEKARLSQRLLLRQHEEFDTPWPVANADVCISFIHIPTHFDGGRSQRMRGCSTTFGSRTAPPTSLAAAISRSGSRHAVGVRSTTR